MRKRIKWNEGKQAYLFILPAVLIILVIAIWPVARSFWISLYDIRLNDPSKAEIHSTYGIDMEKYVGTMPLLIDSLNKELDHVTAADKQTVQGLIEQAKNIRLQLNSNKEVIEHFKEIEQILYDYKPVPQNIKYADVGNEEALHIKEQLGVMEQQLNQLREKGVLNRPRDAIGLTEALKTSFIEPNFIGLTHYKNLFQDARMWTSLWNTVIFTLFSVSVELLLGLFIAVLINKQFKGRGIVRAAVLIPWATPTAISALIWAYLYDGQNGIIAKLFYEFGFISNMGVLLSTKTGAMFSIILADVWKTAPFIALLLLAGLQTIPGTLYEAAKVDGATKWKQFMYLTLPLLKSAILVALLFRTLDAFRVFDLIYVLTGGGPANSTESISIYAYKLMFAQLNFGAGSALSVIVFLCISIICMIYIRFLGSDIINRRT